MIFAAVSKLTIAAIVVVIAVVVIAVVLVMLVAMVVGGVLLRSKEKSPPDVTNMENNRINNFGMYKRVMDEGPWMTDITIIL